jgi:hypothetical protein
MPGQQVRILSGARSDQRKRKPVQDTCNPGTAAATSPAPPDWCEPGAAGDRQELTAGGTVCMWERVISHDVWVGCEDHTIDGHVFRTPARVHIGEQPHALSGEDVRRLAADLLAAADLIDDHRQLCGHRRAIQRLGGQRGVEIGSQSLAGGACRHIGIVALRPPAARR